MQPTNRRLMTVAAAFWLATLAGVSGCGAEDPAASTTASAEVKAGTASRVPVDLVEVLGRDGITVDDATFEGGLSPEESLAAFAGIYDPAMFDATPAAYAVMMRSSQESRLPPGLSARMVHVPRVERDIIGPDLPDDSGTPSNHDSAATMIVETDLFAFFDAESGKHLATVYIGPRQ